MATKDDDDIPPTSCPAPDDDGTCTPDVITGAKVPVKQPPEPLGG